MPIVENVLRTAAFGGSRLAEADAATPPGGGPLLTPVQRWLDAVVRGARGEYAAAAAVLQPLSRHGDGVIASLAASALASHRRQLGGHAAALRLDGIALRRVVEAGQADHVATGPGWGRGDPDGLDQAGALSDALLGLAADHLGLGRLAECEALLTRAARAVAVSGCWRAEVRLGWVQAELALASGRPFDSISPAKRALALAEARGAARHVAKSQLVLGAALVASDERRGPDRQREPDGQGGQKGRAGVLGKSGRPGGLGRPGESGGPDRRQRARELVGAALTEARRNGWRSLTWPALLLFADLEPEQAVWSRSRVTDELSALLASTDPVGRRLARDSPWVPI
ncbi:hypothetical protein [Saccharomonospora xinjiangensis]|uniref:MalT-like TPR region domain-containing protein n=1 Tax=Saccharomonospora xinjiangensis XJ-54 TaxID=882086 RepID=I0V0Y9_9PSEU|nr:hypothetical protein [Saccharomonospora xinjiangensis]EID53792.1 hypothetical protein SacxiDRAFT_1545 [Saccharomonospora xinjiangensis XJ-54]